MIRVCKTSLHTIQSETNRVKMPKTFVTCYVPVRFFSTMHLCRHSVPHLNFSFAATLPCSLHFPVPPLFKQCPKCPWHGPAQLFRTKNPCIHAGWVRGKYQNMRVAMCAQLCRHTRTHLYILPLSPTLMYC